MAIYHCSVKAISRSTGRSATASAAYRSGQLIVDNRTGEVFDYTKKGGVVSSTIVLPDGAPEWANDRNNVWNAAEAAEKRKDACVAREYVIALPHELSKEQQKALALDFAKELVNRHGVIADVCIHKGGKEGDERNDHAHILTSTRVMTNEGFTNKAEIEKAGRKRRLDLIDTRQLWEERCNEHLERAGLDIRVDHRSHKDLGIMLEPSKHLGVSASAMQRKGMDADRVNEHDETRANNIQKIIDKPEIILTKMTASKAVFTLRDVTKELKQFIDDKEQLQSVLSRLEQSPELVQLAPAHEKNGRKIAAKYSTRAMIEIERGLIGTAQALADIKTHGVSDSRMAAIMQKYDTLSDEQSAAIQHVTKAGQLAVIIGDAGTGKSFGMRVAAEAWEAEGYRVRGCALAGKAADELEAGSGIESRTIHSLEASWKNGKDQLTSNDILVIDEAGMVGSRQLSRVLDAAKAAGAKVVMLGDDKQLSAIEAGAGFRGITERVGAAEITQIRRQTEQWAKDASAEFARGDLGKAMDAYNERGHIRIKDTLDNAKQALASDYLADREKGGSSIILAYRNADVIDLNNAVREARKQAGELHQETEFMTERGARSFAAGDRIVMLENNRDIGVKNGSLGTVEAAENGQLTVKMDNGETIEFNADQYANIDHGYAVTVHKSQGVTVDRAYLLATTGMSRELSYVGMTRHKEQATMYAGADDFIKTGSLVAHGVAPYEHDKGNHDSYFVTLENAKGEQHTVWGVDLKRAIEAAGSQIGDKIGLEHVGAENVQLPSGEIAQRNSWKVSTGIELAYDKLVERLSQKKANESTLDYLEATANYAERREFNGFKVVGNLVERGIVKFNEITDSIKQAVGRAIGHSEPRIEPQAQQAPAVAETPKEKTKTAPWQKTYSAADLIGEPAEPKPAPVQAQAPAVADRPPVQPLDVQAKAMQHYRDSHAAAVKAGDQAEIVITAAKLERAEQLSKEGKTITHHTQDIEAVGSAAFTKWADRERAKANLERSRNRENTEPSRDLLAAFRKRVELAQSKGDQVVTRIEERCLELAAEAVERGENPVHRYAKINAQAQADVMAGWQKGQAKVATGERQQEQPKTEAEIKRQKARENLERAKARNRGDRGHGY
ncbi:Ti-type conjugative transfer relaxase TraA [Acinetobacter gerneri]|uniref:Ti-type conjugative transfer relaxase TraA n=1 Tax=Acinetobacter gerneri DSM 14967 = CIP 107464 = MTCC 9824 TaxID=1120926 RepID=N8ZVI2_9GAMM|nr:Ti-type conjugative transfer relaxase TraA [Acinetobacter gerneri]ENV35485.1 Ti-type conjugative transfer relaxase TraA [Acinetobacter gerneri DSM 14967 = CIP 107464 = MTCC 9824]EPR82502.1 hypothetical protein L289_2996 [Acinetobacter gerneri DSM 14967 = CIP 107464 = MTCC 9824]